MEYLVPAGAGVAGLILGVVGVMVLGRSREQKMLGDAQRLREDMVKKAEMRAREIEKEIVEKARDKAQRTREELERDARDALKEAEKSERRMRDKERDVQDRLDRLQREERDLKTQQENLKRTEAGYADRLRSLETQQVAVKEKQTALQKQLEQVASLTAEEARKQLLSSVEEDAKLEAARIARQLETQAKEKVEESAKKIIALAINRYSGDYAAERMVSVVKIPGDEIKGRIIGREGRNIRALEVATGMDFIIDDTPETIVISGYNPLRREVAKRSLEKLIADGRIHPARIEEVVAKSEREVEKSCKEAADQAVMDLGLTGVHPEILKLLGSLKYRTSYTQNQLTHSMEVAFLCGIMASELKLNVPVARRCGLLHDIGKAVSHDVEGPHAYIGGDLLRKYGEKEDVIVGVSCHHDDDPPTIWAAITQAADALSAARPGSRREQMESYVKRVESLEKIASSFPGVERSYAVQAGRELRIMVDNSKVSDDEAYALSKEIAKKIEAEVTYPGQIKITVFRETRATEFAR
ncbi:MAG: ribonuclease Y [Deltaproteobacteria bacterium]|nr:ribonuclease Y [Deltaproteobacteria bacterium]